MMTLALAVTVLAVSWVWSQDNLVTNGDMATDANGDGVPDVWEAAGNPEYVTQKLSSDDGRDGGRCLRLVCTKFTPGNAAAHAMISQVGQVRVQSGKWYRIAFWAKQRGLDEHAIAVALSETKGWSNLGLTGSFLATADWRQYTFRFRANADAHEDTRLQIWYRATGALWLDDVTFTETTDQARPTLVWPAGDRRNLVPNASFEAGPQGWGSFGTFAPTRGWAQNLNQLLGEVVDQQPAEGRRCLRITLTSTTLPVCYFDYFGMTRTPLQTLFTARQGWLETNPDQPYTLSCFLKANRENVTAALGLWGFADDLASLPVTVGRTWQRCQVTLPAKSKWCSPYVVVDLLKSGPEPLTLWMDGVQLEAGDKATEFTPRDPVEAGVSTPREGNVFFKGQPVVVDLAATNASSRPATIELRVTDFADATVATRRCSVPPAARPWRRSVDLGLTKTGFYRVQVIANGGESPRGMRLALIPKYTPKDSIFGVNHAYPWPHLEREAAAAGIKWARDWSIKWQDVQPTEGAPFDFSETDIQINRALAFGQQVLGLLPFPSADWSSSAPPEVKVGSGYPAVRERQAYAPRSEEEFAAWVGATVRHYRGRIKWWQVFNEPLFTDYSLPGGKGYTGKDYGRWVKVFSQAAKTADPRCRILAGIGYWPDHVQKHFEGMFATGALDYLDAIDLHVYPGLTAPEAMEAGLLKMTDLLRPYGKTKPLWLTEHGYYGDDEPETEPLNHSDFDTPLPSERVQAAYSMRFNVILLAHGVDHIFYHAGTSVALNGDNLEGTFFKYAGEPRKIYAALAAFADLFRPGVKPLGEWGWGPPAKAYLFRQGDQLILAAWARPSAAKVTLAWSDQRLAARDLMGNPLPARRLTLSGDPVFLVAKGMKEAELRRTLRRQ